MVPIVMFLNLCMHFLAKGSSCQQTCCCIHTCEALYMHFQFSNNILLGILEIHMVHNSATCQLCMYHVSISGELECSGMAFSYLHRDDSCKHETLFRVHSSSLRLLLVSSDCSASKCLCFLFLAVALTRK